MAKRRKLTQEKVDRINRLRDQREGAVAWGWGPCWRLVLVDKRPVEVDIMQGVPR